ncbi:MAG: acyltransferase [Alphaproteobacteria bacterium]|nr:acyltransferase [Alphaproteobacteria bacterium]
MQSRPTSSGLHLRTLDGVRGMAALFVALGHAGSLADNQSLYGVWIFFVLSGFLLVQPFHARPKAASWRGAACYIARRILRIMPLYAAILFLRVIMEGQDMRWMVNHLTLRWSDGIYWTIKQEMIFYFMLPVVLWMAYSCSGRDGGRALMLAVLSLLAGMLLPAERLPVTGWRGSGSPVPLYMGIFLAGMAMGYAVHSAPLLRLRSRARLWGTGLSVLLIAGWGVLDQLHRPQFPEDFSTWQWHLPLAWTFAAMLAVMTLLPRSPLGRIAMALPLRAIGIVGYSFYMWHVLVMDWFESHGAGGYQLALLTVVCTYACACVTYCLVEAPFLRLARRLRY